MVSEYDIGGGKVVLNLGSVVRHEADAIVFPVDPMLDYQAGPGTLVHSIVEGGHQAVFDEARKMAKSKLKEGSLDSNIPMAVPLGSVHATSAGRMMAENAFHAVVLTYDSDTLRAYATESTISKATKNSLELANEKLFRKIAFPLFGGSVYHMPLGNAAEIMVEEFKNHFGAGTTLNRIAIVVPWQLHYSCVRNVLEKNSH